MRTAAARANAWALSEFEAKNNIYLQTLTKDHNVTLKKFPDEVLKTLEKYAGEVIDELVAADAMSKKVYESFETFRKNRTQHRNNQNSRQNKRLKNALHHRPAVKLREFLFRHRRCPIGLKNRDQNEIHHIKTNQNKTRHHSPHWT